MTMIGDELCVTVIGTASADHVTIVAIEGERAVGHATLDRLYSPRAEVAFHQDGHDVVARALLDALEDAARARGITRLEIDQAGAPASVLLALLTRGLREERRGDHVYLTWPANRQG